ncbi:CotH kinase family protein [Flavicella sp.]|nr:CotH kinase family protein [Flavicella sp.]
MFKYVFLFFIGFSALNAQNPSSAAPTPSKASADVISVYSDAYTSIASDLNPNWGQQTQTTEIQIAGNNTLEYANLNYQGLDYPATDVSAMEFVHLDYYTDDATALDFFLISKNPTVENPYSIAVVTGSWQSIDIPFSVYTANLDRVFQFKTVGNGTVYLDNLYFWKAPGGQSTDTSLSALTVDGNSIASFGASKTSYSVELPAGTTIVPTVSATATDTNASAVVTAATSIPGTTTIVVTAQDGVTTSTISIAFSVASTPPTGSSAAPTPSQDSADVISVFSDAYTNINADLNPNWGQQTQTTEVQIDGNNTLEYANLNYQGMQYAVSDVSAMDYVHLDYKTADATALDFYLISQNPTVENPYSIAIVTGGWQSIDIPLSVYTANLDRVFQFKTEGNGTVYLDNLYFWKTPAAAGTDTSLSALTVDGNSIADFVPTSTNYSVELPAGTTAVPTVSATTTDSDANLVITAATSIPGTTTIAITAQDGSTTSTVSINWTLKPPLSVAAPTPTWPSADVISVYSDAYTSNATNLNPGWGQATNATEIQIDGNNTLEYKNLSYQGLEYSQTDVSAMEFIHLDYYTDTSNFIKFSLISANPRVENAYTIDVVKGSWQTIDIPLSVYTANLDRVFQFKTEGNGTVYLDNLYFWKAPSDPQDLQWETVVSPGHQWHYTLPTSEPSSNWKVAQNAPSNWLQGPSGIGYGDEDDATIVGTTASLFMHTTFEIQNLSTINRLLLDMDYDDGFVAYINGVEIARNLVSGNPVPYNQLSDGLHEALLYRGFSPERYFLNKSLLVNGTNVLAVQVHNQSVDSSDLSALPVLSVEVYGESGVYNDTPFWFEDPNSEPVEFNFDSSNLPLIFLQTAGGQGIPDEPKIEATMKIIERPEGQRNYVYDINTLDYLNFNGPIKIETRGSSSTFFSKKQYALTTYDAIGEKDNVKLLDMPKENDWILSGIAFDTIFMRDFISYKLSNKLGQYASRGRYCEVVLNDSYQGIYMLQEKLKSDGSRIDLNKIKADDTVLPKLSGGYITKSDKWEGNELGWTMPNYGGYNTDFINVHPSPEDILPVQNDYIQSVFQSLAATSASRNSSLIDGYPSIIDIPSFVDFMLINELASNPDAYQFSTYFHKDRNGKLRAGPIWDLNLTFGNDLFLFGFDRSKTDLWQFTVGNRGAKFWNDLYNDPIFKCYLTKRWKELTATGQPLNENEIFDMIDETAALISESVGRQQALWGFDLRFEDRISNLKTFVTQRIQWMSDRLTNVSLCDQVTTPTLTISKINYNPKVEVDEDASDFEFIEITNTSSSSKDLTGVYFGGLGLTYQFPNGYVIEGNASVFLANESQTFESSYGFAPFDEFSRSLANGGQELALLDGYGNQIDFVDYDDKSPWPEEADGNGSYLELRDLDLDNSLPSSWTIETILSSAAIGEDPPKDFLSIYPNPIDTYLNIRIANGARFQKLTLWDVNGRQVESYQTDKSSIELNLETLESGIYFIEIATENRTFYKKLIRK